MKRLTVAIDGPAGAGKSSVAKLVANRLHYLYIDTGAMYRAFTWAMLKNHIDLADTEAVQELTDTIQIRLEPAAEYCRVYVGDTEVTEDIRTADVSSHVSPVAALAVVRTKLVKLQRDMAASGGVILDGRDIGTVVLPDFSYRFCRSQSPPPLSGTASQGQYGHTGGYCCQHSCPR